MNWWYNSGRVYICASLLLICTISSKAGEHVNLVPICDSWDEIELRIRNIERECLSTNNAIRSAMREILEVDDKFPFTSEAQNLKILEFESDEEFVKRVQKQRESESKEFELILKRREAEKYMLKNKINVLAKQCLELTNAMNQAILEQHNFTNKSWTCKALIDVSDLPYFDRESMSFKDIHCPLATHENKDKQIMFVVALDYRYVSFKFDNLKQAQSFKEYLAAGNIKVSFFYEMIPGLPEEYTFREAWTEKKTNYAKSIGAALGIALRIRQALNGGPSFNEYDVANIEHVGDMTKDEIKHSAIIGRKFPIAIKNCQIIIEGDNTKFFGMKLVSPTGKWKLVMQ